MRKVFVLTLVVLAVLAMAVPTSTQTTEKEKSVRFAIEVNFTQSAAEMIAAGRYQIKEGNVDKFPLDQQGTEIKRMDVELIHIGAAMAHDLVLEEIGRRGCRPATARELLSFGILYPDEQRKFPIVALGTVQLLDGKNQVAYLWALGKDRRVGLDDIVTSKTAWHAGVRFLAVPIAAVK